MYYSIEPENRTEFIAALRSLADFLDSNPAVPVPLFGDRITLCADSFDNGGKAQVDQIACLLGGAITDETATGGHYLASRQFGPLGYEAVAIPDACTARYEAEKTYRGCVAPDTDPFAFTDCGNPGCTRQHPCDDCHEAINRASVRRTSEASWL
jgi:hypothetical protein